MFRTRIGQDIVVEFLPPARRSRKEKVIVLCDGMPSIPRKQGLAGFLADKGFWVFYPRYRGAWESGGQFLARSPHEDILDVITALKKPIVEITFGKRFRVNARQIFVIGGSFGGAAAILCSLDPLVKKVIAKLSSGGLVHSSPFGTRGNLQSRLRRLPPRGVRERLQTLRTKLEQIAIRNFLQSCAPH